MFCLSYLFIFLTYLADLGAMHLGVTSAQAENFKLLWLVLCKCSTIFPKFWNFLKFLNCQWKSRDEIKFEKHVPVHICNIMLVTCLVSRLKSYYIVFLSVSFYWQIIIFIWMNRRWYYWIFTCVLLYILLIYLNFLFQMNTNILIHINYFSFKSFLNYYYKVTHAGPWCSELAGCLEDGSAGDVTWGLMSRTGGRIVECLCQNWSS